MTIKTMATLVSLETDGDEIVRFCLKLGERIEFSPSQYGRITIPDPKYSDDRGGSRTLTIVSEGESKYVACFATRAGKSAFKRSLVELETGTALEFTGPFGKFFAMGEARCCVFIAGGIGITPVASLFFKLHDMQEIPEIVVFHLNEGNSRFPLSADLEAAGNGANHVAYIRIMSGSRKLDGVENGKLDFNKISGHVPDSLMSEAVFYISGPNSLVKDIRPMLLENGIEDKRIRVEIFPGY